MSDKGHGPRDRFDEVKAYWRSGGELMRVDFAWLILEVERLREALELHNLRAALDSYQNAKPSARPEPTRPDPGISESVKHPYPPIPPPPPNEGVTVTEGWGRWWKR